MRMSHVVMFVAALFCAATAAFFTRTWLVSQSAQAPANVETAAKPSRSIVVAARDLKYAETLTSEDLKLVSWPGDAMPKGAFISTEALLGPAGSRTVTRDMTQGEPILSNKLLGGGSSNRIPEALPPGMKAVTIRVNDIAGVAGFVQPEDRVDVFLTYGDKSGTETSTQISSSVVVLLQNIRVLAIDQTTERKETPTPAKAVTLEVSTQDAQKLTLAGNVGNLSLALNRIEPPVGPELVGTVQFHDLTDPGPGQVEAPKPGGPVVTITRSTDRKNYQVQADDRRDENWQHQILRQTAPPPQ